MKVIKSIIASILLSMCLLIYNVSCVSTRVVTDKLETADFTAFRSFQIMEPETIGMEKVYFNQLNRNRVKKAVTEQLQLRGYKVSEGADLNVHIYVKTETKMDVISNSETFYGPYNYWGQGPSGVRSYREGTLIIDLVDTTKDELVWHGVAVSTIDGPYKDMGERIKKVIAAIFDRYPYMAGSDTPSDIQ